MENGRLGTAAAMYRVRTRNYDKQDQAMRWRLPDRVFFACGACHILAHAFLERHGRPGMAVLWIRPASGYTGNHLVVVTDRWVFDYHGYVDRQRYFDHVRRVAVRRWPGWNAALVEVPADVLLSTPKSRRHGMWLREPGDFLHDPLPRARTYLDRFPAPACPAGS